MYPHGALRSAHEGEAWLMIGAGLYGIYILYVSVNFRAGSMESGKRKDQSYGYRAIPLSPVQLSFSAEIFTRLAVIKAVTLPK
jgi:hypothetical protein